MNVSEKRGILGGLCVTIYRQKLLLKKDKSPLIQRVCSSFNQTIS